MRDLMRLSARLSSEPWFVMPGTYEDLVRLLAEYQQGRVPVPDWRAGDGAGLRPPREAMEVLEAESWADQLGVQAESWEYQKAGRFWLDMDGSGVAVVRACGVMGKRLDWMAALCGGCDVDDVVHGVRHAVASADVRRVLVDVSSPGGSGIGLPEASAALTAAAKEKMVVAYTDTQCCSAAYWLTAGCSELWAAGSAQVGSIGGFITWLDMVGAYEAAGLKRELLKVGKLKGEPMPGLAMSDAGREHLQLYLERHVGMFKDAVRAARPAVADAAMEGQFFDGEEAHAAGLVDVLVDSLGEAIGLMQELDELEADARVGW